MSDPVQALIEAAKELRARNIGESIPRGEWIDNNKGRWWLPDLKERQDCCLKITTYLGAENHLFNHCRTALHISRMYDVSYEDITRAAAILAENLIPEPLLPELWTIVKATEKLKGTKLSIGQIAVMAYKLTAMKSKEGC